MRRNRRLALGAALLALAMSACAPGEGSSPGTDRSPAGDADRPEVRVGSAAFGESAVVAEIYAQALEAAGFTVERTLELGARDVTHAALTSDQINLMPEYIGAYLAFFEGAPTADADATFSALEAELEGEGLVALDYSPGTDADGWVVRQETADEFGLATMSDISPVAGDLTWGLAPECGENPLCGPGLNEVYGIDIEAIDVEALAPCSAAMAEALDAGAIDVAQVCTTQAEIERFGFVLLEDDGGLAPAQNIAPIVTAELAEAGGESLSTALNAVSELLTTEELTSLNARIAEQQSYEAIAREWLEANGLN